MNNVENKISTLDIINDNKLVASIIADDIKILSSGEMGFIINIDGAIINLVAEKIIVKS